MTIGTPPAHLSNSQVESILGCGMRYKLERILRAPQKPAHWFTGGSAVHSATEALDKEAHETGEIWDDEQVTDRTHQILNDEIEKTMQESGMQPDLWSVGGRGKEGLDWWMTEAPGMVRKWRDWLYASDNPLDIWRLPNDEPAIEVELMVVFGDQPVKMAIDRVLQDSRTGELITVDIKAGSREPQGYQLPLYNAAICRAFGIEVKYASYWMARKGYLTPPKDTTGMALDLDDRFAKARLMIDNEIFLAVPGMFCGSCSVAPYCTAVGGSPEPLFLGGVS